MTTTAINDNPARCKSGADIPLWIARHLAGIQSIPQEASFFLLAIHYEEEAERRFDDSPELATILDQMKAVKLRYGLDPQFHNWEEGMEPPEYVDLQKAHDELYDRTWLDVFREHGETALAELYRNDNAEYDRRREAGRRWFLEPHEITE